MSPMGPSPRSLAMPLLVVALAACTALCVQADQRSVLMNVGGKPPHSIASASVSILHSMPRWASANHSLGSVDPNNEENLEEAQAYAFGILLPIVICFFLGLFTWAVCFGFGCCRNCCNACGGRMNSRKYNERDRLWLKVGIVILGAASVVLFGLGLVSNAAVSSSLDKAYIKCDALIEHLYQFHAPLLSMSTSTTDALQQVQSLNSTVLARLPSNVSSDQACLQYVYDTTQTELQALSQMASATAHGAANLTLLSQRMLSLQSTKASFPDLTPQAADMQLYNASIRANLPFPLQTKAAAPANDMRAAQTHFQTASSTSALITSLNTALTSAAPTITPVRTGLTSYDTSNAAASVSTLQSLAARLTANENSAGLTSDVNALDAAVAALPVAATFLSDLSSFQTQLNNLQSLAAPVITAFATYASDLSAIANCVPFSTLLSALQTPGVSNVQHSAVLVSSLQNSAPSIATLTSRTSQTALSTTSAISSVAKLQTALDGTAGSLGVNMRSVNTSLPGVKCIQPVFTELLYLNTSVLILPSEMSAVLSRRSQILVQLKRLARIQSDLTAAFNTMPSVSASLTGFPNLNSISTAISNLDAALQAFPDSISAASQITSIDSALAALTPAYLSSLVSGTTTFNSSLSAHSPPVRNLATAVASLSSALASFPSSLNAWFSYASAINSAASNMASNLATVKAQVNMAGYSPVVDPLKTNFLAQLQTFTDIRQGMGSNSGFESALDALAPAITAVQNSQTGIDAALTGLQNAATTLPSTAAVATAMQLVYSAVAFGPLGPLLNGGVYSTLNSTLRNLPDMTSSSSSVASYGSAVAPTSANLKLVESNLLSAEGFMSLSDLVANLAGLEAMRGLSTQFPDLDSPLGNLQIASSGLADAESHVADYRHRYYVARQSTVVFKNHIDWLRLLGYMLVLLVPTCVTFCGLLAWVKQKPRASLYMGFCSFSIAAIFFIMTAVQIGPAMLFADQCQDLDAFLKTNLDQFGLASSAAQPWINLTETTKMSTIFQYFSSCDIAQPELMRSFANPQKVLADNAINFTDYRVRVRNSLSEFNDTIALQSAVWGKFDALDNDVNNVVAASGAAYSLFDCTASAAVWAPFRDSLCATNGVTGAISLSTCVCFLFAICMLPGVCVGIMGYKRFDPAYLSEDKVINPLDPYAAGLAEKPAKGAGAAGKGAAAAAKGGNKVPLEAASPIGLNEIEMQQQQQPNRRATLQMALASEPQYDPAHAQQPQHYNSSPPGAASLASPSHMLPQDYASSPLPPGGVVHYATASQMQWQSNPLASPSGQIDPEMQYQIDMQNQQQQQQQQQYMMQQQQQQQPPQYMQQQPMQQQPMQQQPMQQQPMQQQQQPQMQPQSPQYLASPTQQRQRAPSRSSDNGSGAAPMQGGRSSPMPQQQQQQPEQPRSRTPQPQQPQAPPAVYEYE